MTSQPPLFPHLVAAKWMHDVPTPVSVVARDLPHLRPVTIDPTDYEHYLARGRKMRAQAAGRLARALSTMLGQALDALRASISRILQRSVSNLSDFLTPRDSERNRSVQLVF